MIGPMALHPAEKKDAVGILAEAKMDARLQVGLALPTSNEVGAAMVTRQLEALHSAKE